MSGYPLVTGDDAWQYKPIPSFLGGINLSARSDQIEDSQTIQLKNVLARDGILRNDTGYREFAQDVIGIPQREVQFLRQSQETEFILITTRTVYKFDSGSDRWHLIKGLAGVTINATVYYGGTVFISVTGTAGFSAGDLIGIATTDGDQFQTTIANVLVNAFELTDPIPTGKIVLLGAAVVRAVVLAGDLDHQVDSCVVASHDWLVFTNGVDDIKRYDGDDCTDVTGAAYKCNAVAFFNAALFLFGTTEAGTYFPWRARRSDQGDPTEWVNGTAGKDDLLETAGAIVCAKLLGPYCIAYKQGGGIYRGQFIGSFDVNYQWDLMVPNEGVLSTNSVVETEIEHFVVGERGIYKYRGDFSLIPISPPIFNKLFGVRGNLNAAQRHRTFAIPVHELNEIWVLYPSTNATNPDTVLRFNYLTGMWYERQFDDEFLGYGLYLSLEIFSWDDLEGSWDEQTWQWDSQVIVEDSFSIHLLTQSSDTAGKVYEYDYLTTLDNGAAIEYTVESKDFVVPDAELRFDMLEMKIQGTDVNVFYSIDQGDTWTNLGIVTSEKLDKMRLFSQFLFNTIRFRWQGNSRNFRLDWAGFSYKIESL